MIKIGVFIGSLSVHAYCYKLAQVLKTSYQAQVRFFQINYSTLPLYNPDLEEADLPIEWQTLRSIVAQLDALLFITPEYNYSLPGGLKNALDVLSVPYPPTYLANKPAMIITASAGQRGGLLANVQLQQVLQSLQMRVFKDEVTFSEIHDKFNAQSQLTDNQVKQFLLTEFQSFLAFIPAKTVVQPAEPVPLDHLQYCWSPQELLILNSSHQAIANIELEIQQQVVCIQAVNVKASYRGQHLGTKALKLLLMLISQANYQVVAQCPFAKQFLAQHPEYASLVVQ